MKNKILMEAANSQEIEMLPYRKKTGNGHICRKGAKEDDGAAMYFSCR